MILSSPKTLSKSMRESALLAAAALLAATAALAQQTPGNGAPPPGPPQQSMPQSPQSPNATPTGNDQMDMQKMADQSFVRDTIENSDDQVRLSQLAGEKSTSPDVKQFSEEMVKVHGQLESQLRPAASQMGVDAPKGPSKKEKKEIARLQGLSGQDFDAAYIEDMGHAQRESLKQFHDESENSENPALKQAAGQDTPILTQHYQILEKIAQAHNVDLEGKEKK